MDFLRLYNFNNILVPPPSLTGNFSVKIKPTQIRIFEPIQKHSRG